MADESGCGAELVENGHGDKLSKAREEQLSGTSTKRSSHDGADSAESSRKMFVGGLNRGTTDEGMREYFLQFGEIESCLIKCDPTTNRSRGFGFVTFKERSSVDKVMSTTHMLDERKIDPKLAVPYPKSRTRKIFVGGLPAELADGDLRRYFGQYGPVDDVELPVDRTTGGRKGFGFISFETEEAVEAAMRQTFHTIGEYTVEVKRAVVKDQHQQQLHFHANGQRRGGANAIGQEMHIQQGLGGQAAAAMQVQGYGQVTNAAAAYQQYGGYAAAQPGYGTYGSQVYSPYSFGAYAAAFPYYYPYAGLTYGQQVQAGAAAAAAQPQQQQQQQQHVAFTPYTPTVTPSATDSSKYGPVRNNSTTASGYRPY